MSRVPLLLLALLLALAAPAQAAERRVPQGWLGVVADGPLTAAHAGEWDAMVGAGVESVRTAVRWYELQPYGSAAEVPPADAARFRDAGGVPTDFTALDAVDRRRRRARPRGAARRAGDARLGGRRPRATSRRRPPTRRRSAASSRRSRGRYGPQGSLWAERPDLPRVPVRAWQIWNEPNLTRYWSEQPFAPLLRAAAQGGRRGAGAADPGATVVLAGLPNVSWTALRQIYKAGRPRALRRGRAAPVHAASRATCCGSSATRAARCAARATGARRSG